MGSSAAHLGPQQAKVFGLQISQAETDWPPKFASSLFAAVPIMPARRQAGTFPHLSAPRRQLVCRLSALLNLS